MFNSPVIKSIAAEVNRSAAQVVLRWALQSGQVLDSVPACVMDEPILMICAWIAMLQSLLIFLVSF